MNVYLDPAIHGPYREARNRKTVPILGTKARPNIELPAMRSTGHDGPFQATLTQRIVRMGTPVLHGVDNPFDPKKTDIDPLDLDAQTSAMGNVFVFSDSLVTQWPAFVRGRSLGSRESRGRLGPHDPNDSG